KAEEAVAVETTSESKADTDADESANEQASRQRRRRRSPTVGGRAPNDPRNRLNANTDSDQSDKAGDEQE
ncbi:hypothetical protein, partial [Thalassolituus sp.]|uniref:hypothetical protein n=1 Tax=Thalassolituus sp. TaxID=2030822 RepID=UPI002A82B51D